MKCKFLRGYKIYELSFLNFNPLGIIWVAWSAGRCVCYLPNSNMFLILTAKNCGRARRKLLTSTSLVAMRPPLPFCINNGRSFSELQRKSVFFHSISFELAINYGLLSKRELCGAHYAILPVFLSCCASCGGLAIGHRCVYLMRGVYLMHLSVCSSGCC